jgi:hypothetical protein
MSRASFRPLLVAAGTALCLALSVPARAEDPTPAGPAEAAPTEAAPATMLVEPATPPPAAGPSRDEIETVIAQQSKRRSGAIGGFVIGGIVILGGIIKTAVDTVDEADEKQARGDDSATPYKWTGTLIGLAVATPIMWGSAVTLADANKQLKKARRQRAKLAFQPTPQGGQLVLALEF